MSESTSSSSTSGTTSKSITTTTKPAEAAPPPDGSAQPTESLEHVASAAAETDPRSLASLAKIDEAQFDVLSSLPGDPTEIVEGEYLGQKVTAAKTTGAELGAYGQQTPGVGEVAGGNMAKVLDPPPDLSKANVPLVKERAALLSPIGQKLSGFINRPPNEWGLLGSGDTVKGQMFLLDLNTGEKVRAMDGHKINEGQLFANLRNFPEALSTGDTIEQLLSS